jgi:hypothetical protein
MTVVRTIASDSVGGTIARDGAGGWVVHDKAPNAFFFAVYIYIYSHNDCYYRRDVQEIRLDGLKMAISNFFALET